LNTVTVIFLGHFGAAGEPFGVGPALHHFLGLGVAGLGLLAATSLKKSNISSVFFSASAATAGHFSVVQQFDQRVTL
jgi:hypothetical protein